MQHGSSAKAAVGKHCRPVLAARGFLGATPQNARDRVRCPKITGGNIGHLSNWPMKTEAPAEPDVEIKTSNCRFAQTPTADADFGRHRYLLWRCDQPRGERRHRHFV
jgi:hypothetical protein